MVWAFIKKQRAILEVEQRRNRASTYMEPLKGGDLPGEQEALKEFLTDFYRNILYKRQAEMRDLLNSQYPDTLGQQYKSLVAQQKVVSNDDFWMRYYYRCNVDHVLREWEWDEQRRQIAAEQARAQREAEQRVAEQAAAAQEREAQKVRDELAKKKAQQQAAAKKAQAAAAAKQQQTAAAKKSTPANSHAQTIKTTNVSTNAAKEHSNPLAASAAAVVGNLSSLLNLSDHNKENKDEPLDEPPSLARKKQSSSWRSRNTAVNPKKGTITLKRVATPDRPDVVLRGLQRREFKATLVVLLISVVLVCGNLLPLPLPMARWWNTVTNGLCAPLPPGWQLSATIAEESESNGDFVPFTKSTTSPWWIPVDMTLPRTDNTVKDVVSRVLCGEERPRTRLAWTQEKNGLRVTLSDLATTKTLLDKRGLSSARVWSDSLEFTKNKKDAKVEWVEAPWKAIVVSSGDNEA